MLSTLVPTSTCSTTLSPPSMLTCSSPLSLSPSSTDEESSAVVAICSIKYWVPRDFSRARLVSSARTPFPSASRPTNSSSSARVSFSSEVRPTFLPTTREIDADDESTVGTYASAVTGDTELSRLLLEFGKTADDDEEVSSGDETVVVEEVSTKIEAEVLSETLLRKASVALMRKAVLIPVDVQKRETLKELKRSTRPKENREQGSVQYSVYKNFLKANSYTGVCSHYLLLPCVAY